MAKADAALRQKEGELASLRAEHQTLTVELTAVKHGLRTSAERVENLQEEGQVGNIRRLNTNNQTLVVQQDELTSHCFCCFNRSVVSF